MATNETDLDLPLLEFDDVVPRPEQESTVSETATTDVYYATARPTPYEVPILLSVEDGPSSESTAANTNRTRIMRSLPKHLLKRACRENPVKRRLHLTWYDVALTLLAGVGVWTVVREAVVLLASLR